MHQVSHSNQKTGFAALAACVSSRSSAFWTTLCLSGFMLLRLAGIGLNAAELVVISLWPEVAEASLVRGQIAIGEMIGGKAQIIIIFASGLLLFARLLLCGLSAFLVFVLATTGLQQFARAEPGTALAFYRTRTSCLVCATRQSGSA